MILLFCMLGGNLCYGQTNNIDSVLLSIDEVRIVAKIINENNYLRVENGLLDSMITINTEQINVLTSSLSTCQIITEQQTISLKSFSQVDALRVKQINQMMIDHKKDKRKTTVKFTGVGIVLGVIATLLLN